MNQLLPVARLAALLGVAAWLGAVLMGIPEPQTLSLPDQGVVVSVPRNLEGWMLEPGQGEILVAGHTRLGLVTLEIAMVPASRKGDLYDQIEERHAKLKEGKAAYAVWLRGADATFGGRSAPTYKATYRGEILGPLTGEIWQQDTYLAYRGQYARISMRYPGFLAAYVEPDRAFIASGLRLEP